MTTYNTGNALGSSDARDLYDNAENIDNFANGAANTYQDRLGVTRKSLAGMRNAFDDFIQSSGYTVPVAYTSGIVLSEYNQLIEYNDEFYKLKAGQAPYTTTGTWGTDSAKLVSVGDAALRQELTANANDFSLLPEIANYAALQAYTGDVTAYYVRGVGNIFDGGAGIFRVDAADTTTADNGGTVLVDATGRRWKREYNGPASILWFGASPSGVADSTTAIQAAINSCLHVYAPPGAFKLTSTLVINDRAGFTLEGAGKGTVFQQSGDYGDVFHAYRAAGPMKGITLKHFKTKPSVSSVTSGSAIKFDGVRDFLINDVLIDSAFVGITFAGCGQGVVSDVMCLYESDNGGVITGRRYIHILETTNANIVSKHSGDIFFDNFNGRCGGFPACEHGVVINSMDGVWFDNFHIGNCTASSIFINANSSIKCTGGLFTNGWLDIGTASDVVIRGSTPSLNGNHYFRGNKLLGGNSGNHGFDIDGSAVRLVIQDNEISNYQNAGILIRSTFTGNGDIVSNTIRDCSQSGDGDAPGINYQSNTFWRIENNNIFGEKHSQHIAIAGSKTEARINNNLLGRLFTGPSAMSDLVGTHISQRDNRGYNPRGPVSESVGASPWTYTNSWGFPVEIQIRGGTVTQIIKDTQTYNAVVNSGTFMLDPGKSLTITYSAKPFVYIYGH